MNAETMVALALAGVLAAAGARARQASEAERADLVAFAAATDAAWLASDAAKLADSYTAEGLLVGYPQRSRLQGREAIRGYFAGSFARRPPRLRHVTQVGGIEMLSSDMAFVDTHVRLEQRQGDGSWKLLRYFSNQSLIIRADGRWRNRHVRAHVKPEAEAVQVPAG